jgi:hypothetical protein
MRMETKVYCLFRFPQRVPNPVFASIFPIPS